MCFLLYVKLVAVCVQGGAQTSHSGKKTESIIYIYIYMYTYIYIYIHICI
jgi:hypothetical protein